MKFLEVPDYHFSPAWMDVNERVAGAIAKAARENQVDFVAFPGDIYDRSLQASDKGGLNHLREQIRSITAICPAVAVYGTPSHEPPGSLENLEDCGLTILRPGRVYGYYSGNEPLMHPFPPHVVDVKEEQSGVLPSCILFGIPEINKNNIQAQLSLSADEANAEAVNLFYRYIDEFIAPMRMKYKDIPAVALFHGNVSDARKENEIDIIKRASDIVPHAERMMAANIDRWILGHIHTPWESEIICAGYAGYTGIDSNPWGKLGFVPGMNLVDVGQVQYKRRRKMSDPPQDSDYGTITTGWLEKNIIRIPYGMPERRKITNPAQAVDPAVAYWLDSDNPDAHLPDNVHPWSRMTYNPKRQETRRITREEAAKIKSLRDLFKLIDPEVKEPVLKLVDGMESKIGTVQRESVDVQMKSVEIEGCIFFKGHKYSMTIDKLSTGLNGVRGDNGAGKSSGLAFWSPYPVIIGKDTKSGRASAIKDFFDAQDSVICKSLTLNGIPHEHVITIRGAHTRNPKTECYLTIDGKPKLDKGTFDEMMATCEELYGPYSDYLLTSFYVQPLQGKTESSLMSATMTDIRNLVQSIAGIDRETEKRHALDQVNELDTKIKDMAAWLSGVSEHQVDISALENESSEIGNQIIQAQSDLLAVKSAGESKRDEYDKAVAEKQRSDAEAEKQRTDEARGFTVENEIGDKRKQIADWRGAAGALKENQALLEADNRIREENRQNAEARTRNENKRLAYDRAVDKALREIERKNIDMKNEYDKIKQTLGRNIDDTLQSIKNALRQSEIELVKCSNCGFIEPDAQARSDKHKAMAEELNNTLVGYEGQLQSLVEPIPIPPEHNIPEPDYESVGEDFPAMPDEQRAEVDKAVTASVQAQANITATEKRIEELETESAELSARTYNVNDSIAGTVEALNAELEELRKQHTEMSASLSSMKTQRDNLVSQINKAREVETKIETTKADLAASKDLREKWDYIARMLQPAKIPAAELELVLDAIDDTATSVLSPFQQSRYSYHTETQQQGKTGTVDRFDIRIHDAETGREKSFLEHSPGEKAFFADAYVKALVEQRNTRARRSYDPVIMDESDGPIQPERIAAYYEIQSEYWRDSHVLIVSHSPTSHAYIENNIDMEEVLT